MIRRGSSREYLNSNDGVTVKQKAEVRNRDVMMRLRRFGDNAFLDIAKCCRQVSDRWMVINGIMETSFRWEQPRKASFNLPVGQCELPTNAIFSINLAYPSCVFRGFWQA